MLGQLVVSQFAIEAAMADLAGADPTVRDQLRSQLSLIAGLQQQIGTAQGGTLSALRAEVTALAGNATAAAQEARTAASAGSAASNIATLARTAREQVTNVMAGMKDFDSDLRFSSREDEAEYRKREAERRALIEAEQAKGTPKGDSNAAHAAIDQLQDAGAHGADRNPTYRSRLDALTATTAHLDAALAPIEPVMPERATPAAINAPAQATSTDLNDAMAALQAAGVKASEGTGNGVAVANKNSRDVATSVQV